MQPAQIRFRRCWGDWCTTVRSRIRGRVGDNWPHSVTLPQKWASTGQGSPGILFPITLEGVLGWLCRFTRLASRDIRGFLRSARSRPGASRNHLQQSAPTPVAHQTPLLPLLLFPLLITLPVRLEAKHSRGYVSCLIFRKNARIVWADTLVNSGSIDDRRRADTLHRTAREHSA